MTTTRKKKAGTTRRITTTTEEEPNYAEIDDPFERARAQFGESITSGQVRLVILRHKPVGEPEYLSAYEFDEETHTPDWIRETYGAGKYVLRFLDRASREQWSKTFPIAELPSDAPPTTAATDYERLLREQNEKLMQGLLVRGGMAPPQSGGSEESVLLLMMKQQSELNAILMQSLLNKPDTTSLFLSGAEKIFEVVSNMKAESEGSWVTMLPRIAKELSPLLQSMRPPPGSVPPAPYALPGGAPPAPAPMPPQQLAPSSAPAPAPSGPGFTRTGPGNAPPAPVSSDIREETGKVDDLVTHYTPQFLEAAKNNIHPGEIANGVLDSVPAVYHTALDAISVEDIISKEPQLVGFRDWLNEMVEYVRGDEQGQRGYDPPPPSETTTAS